MKRATFDLGLSVRQCWDYRSCAQCVHVTSMSLAPRVKIIRNLIPILVESEICIHIRYTVSASVI